MISARRGGNVRSVRYGARRYVDERDVGDERVVPEGAIEVEERHALG